ncbi:hypothetical protein IEQ34_009686 [Dendrobium chrysotoxum]|uniref:RING-type domain-containing protein n=1 Tax=Dendrobium chrysotoxum TaxID=161865 RepID=A0AAV7H132_DENCH|nr:hypothetical protein IEQ34_009686 [Dendrobium chrysotoxum]
MVLNVDLNDHPAESWQFEDDAAPIDLQHEQITIFGTPGSFLSPIDADAIPDDDVILLPSSAWVSPVKSQSRRKRPVTVVIDEGMETNTWQSGVVEEPVTTLSLSIQKLHTSIPSVHTSNPSGRTIIDCDLNANEKCIPKGMMPNPATWEASAPNKEHNISCPVCLGTLNEPSTTTCGHLFCRSCIETAILKQKKCPTCRRKLTKRNFHRVYLP